MNALLVFFYHLLKIGASGGLDGWAVASVLQAVPGWSAGATWLGVDLIGAIRASDLVGKGCIATTTIFSIISWAIILYKWLHIQHVTRQTNGFVGECLESGGSLEEAYRASTDYPASPLAQILRETYVELELEDWYRGNGDLSIEDRLAVAKPGVERVIERTIANQTRRLESYLIFLAITANVCPFIGLFGTVWGVLGAFQSLAATGSAAIQSLAPGISTALVTTIAGLMAAIPAAVFYNWFVARIQNLLTRMDTFALELSNVVQRRIVRGS